MTTTKRNHFGSRLGIILASAGSAVGLGNVWRFPTEAGRNGGAAFILIYLIMVILIAMPVMVGEFVVGRASKANAVHSYQRLGAGRLWGKTGYLCVLGGFMVLSFYCVIAGWTLQAVVSTLAGEVEHTNYASQFNAFISHPWLPLLYMTTFLLLTHLVVSRGVQKGIEWFSKTMMPLLFLIILLLMGVSLSMPGAKQGVQFLLQPDFSKITTDVVLSAMGQAFFTLSVGISCLATYASYFKDDTPLIKSALNVCAIDTLVAVVSGFIIFPAIFTMPGAQVDAGPALVFITLPYVLDYAFASYPALSFFFMLLFYLLLFLAALTSSISMHELTTAYLSEQFQLTRRRASTIVLFVCLVFGVACSLSFGPWKDYTLLGLTIFDVFDSTTAKIIMPLGGLLITLFVGWRMNRQVVMDQLTNGGQLSPSTAHVILFLIRWVAPIGVSIVFINQFL